MSKKEVMDEEEKKGLIIPPIKCQGIKTKLVRFIKEHSHFSADGTWIEPFVGTGVVVFNVQPKNAILADKNQYIIDIYKKIQSGEITGKTARVFFEYHGSKLREEGSEYYKKMRNEFNKNKDSMYFLFLNRAGFNGMIRFNRKGEFNIPFCQKKDRFAKAYVTKICNQIDRVAEVMKGKNWVFICQEWQKTMEMAKENDFVYLDPPYIGRDTSYVGEWPEEEAIQLAEYAHKTPANVALSMWKENQYRKNNHLYDHWSDFKWYEQEHFYHVGAKESNRHPMIEILAIKR